MNQPPAPINPIADYHMHLTSEEVALRMLETLPHEILGDYKPHLCSADQMIKVLDQSGVQSAYALSNAYQWGMDLLNIPTDEEYELVKFENNFAANEAARYPDRLVPFLSINPLKEYALTEIDRCVNDLGQRGLKLHFANSAVDLRNPEHVEQVKKVLTHAENLDLPVLIDFLSRNPLFGARDVEIFLNEIVSKLPWLKLQMAHLGSGGTIVSMIEAFGAFITAFEQRPQLDKTRFYFDLAAVISDGSKPLTQALTGDQPAVIADQIRRCGVERVLFATDWPLFEPAEAAEMIKKLLPLSNLEYTTILQNKGMVE